MSADVEVFDYAAVAVPDPPSWEAFPSIAREDAVGRIEAERADAQRLQDDTHAKELEGSFAAGMARGRDEGRAAERQALAAAAKSQEPRLVSEASRLIDGFDAQRKQYFENVEREVVRLALAIAARILRREAQMDPLLLSGAVRVALGQLSAATQVRLRVPASDLDLWKDTIAHLPNLHVRPEAVAGKAMRLGECVLEADLGSVDLGLGSQLEEIERGFFDRNQLRTRAERELSEEDMAE